MTHLRQLLRGLMQSRAHRNATIHESDWQNSQPVAWVVLENSNVAKLASPQYLSVHSLPQEDCYDTDDASAREIYPILVPESTMCPVQSSRRRQHRASILDRDTQAYRTAALRSMQPGVFRTGGHLDGPQ